MMLLETKKKLGGSNISGHVFHKKAALRRLNCGWHCLEWGTFNMFLFATSYETDRFNQRILLETL